MRNALLMFVLAIGVAALLYTWLNSTTAPSATGYGEFLGQVQQGQVETVTQRGETLTVKLKGSETTYSVVVPSILTQVYPDIKAAAEAGNQTFDSKIYTAEQPPDNSWIGLLLTGLLPLLVIGGFIYFMMRQAQGT
ncbi:MAG: ATP-dependent metallopeptidase FtsH/Yme1/Tma family protein, partial [Candidatus Limnocylindrales bacterium]